MARQARLDAPGTLHHVMVRGIERRRIVDDKQDRKEFVARLGTAAIETATSVYAWALLSNHAHILIRLLKYPLHKIPTAQNSLISRLPYPLPS